MYAQAVDRRPKSGSRPARPGPARSSAGVLTHLRVEPTKRGGGEHRRIQLDLPQPIFHHDLQWLHPPAELSRACVRAASAVVLYWSLNRPEAADAAKH
jgi:hypothetical protein